MKHTEEKPLEHTQIHTGENPSQCKIWGKTYARKHDLSKHMQTHTAEKNKQCRFCAKIFPTALNLSKHMLSHIGEKPYKCTECNKTLILYSDIQNFILNRQI